MLTRTMAQRPHDTTTPAYTRHLERRAAWKRWIDVQAPYRWNLRRLQLGFTLDLGCGIGRNLAHLGGQGVGVDHNPHSVEAARRRGLVAFTNAQFPATERARRAGFDALLVAHVLEHMQLEAAIRFVGEYLTYLKPRGRVVLITPQEAGFAIDPSHVAFTGFPELERVLAAHGLVHEQSYSFPFPRFAGRFFLHNEFVVVGRKDGPVSGG